MGKSDEIIRPPLQVPYTPEEDPDRAREEYNEWADAQFAADLDYENGWRL